MATAAAAKDDQPAHRFAKDQLKAFVERVERLEEEKKTIADDIRDVYAEAKGNGFDVKTLRVVVRSAQAGPQRAQGAGGHSGDLFARARHAVTSHRPRCGLTGPRKAWPDGRLRVVPGFTMGAR